MFGWLDVWVVEGLVVGCLGGWMFGWLDVWVVGCLGG